MRFYEPQQLIPQAAYAKKLRPYLPAEAFDPSASKLGIIAINLTILILGWTIARHLHGWPTYILFLFIPLAVIMGNSVTVLLFGSHDLMHGSVLRNPSFTRLIALLGLTMLWMPPTLWKAVHNKVHHNHTNSRADPDRNYMHNQANTWGKWIQNAFVPSSTVNPFRLAVGMAF